MSERTPTVEELKHLVVTYDKRVGLRKLYKDFDVAAEERHKFRELWGRFYDLLPDAYGKEESAEKG